MSRYGRAACVAVLLAALVGVNASSASAEPATSVSYPQAASATRFNGLAFDACDAPSLTAMRAWESSPYGGVGVYIGGPNRTCAQRNLTAPWVSTVSREGWRLIPIYMGSQAPCTTRPNSVEFTAATASARGTTEAADAVTRAKALGMLPGSAIYGDVEHYTPTDSACRTAVLAYVSSWTKELHRQGYLAGIYAGLNSGALHLSQAYNSTSTARPDALWIARWDEISALTGWAGIPNTHWANHQRGKQYRGDHDETYGGVTINIDNDRFDAPVATVAHSYLQRGSTVVSARRGPTTSNTIAKRYEPGATVQVICQTAGSKVGSSTVWDLLADGYYVPDYYISTPSNTGYSRPLPRCTYPYQVISSALYERTGPGTGYAVARTLYAGGLAWVSCQRSGTRVGTSAVWDRLEYGNFVSDYYVATPSSTTYSRPPIPRC
ncbi:glycoside hydrolase domain-containing protein [Lysobacter korlensis]|uniref:Glycoside hydrolase domain-containing protein n=1 Tax=Lysobacter korlensis TaxID=553636 RepID=A0ABV6RNV8_9GAMM